VRRSLGWRGATQSAAPVTSSAGESRGGPVGLDVAPARDQPTGVGVYVRELALALEVEVGHRIVRLGVRRGGPLDGSTDADTRSSYLRGGHHLSWLLLHAEADARRAQCSLVHWTNAAAPLRTTLPFVVTIHDLSILRMPGRHPTARLAAVPFVVGAARRARRVIVPSEATAADVRQLLRVPSSRITVIPHAARSLPSDVPDNARLLDARGLRPGGYVLAVGTLEPRKNHLRLLAAFERLALSHPELRLVIAGARGWRNGQFDRALRASPVRDRVVTTGYVDDADLAVLLRKAGVLAYVSLLEGFGLPVAEALAAGVPVVTSTTSSLPEVAGGAAILVDPTDVAAVSRGLEEAIRRRPQLVQAGLRLVARRTWRDVALETLNVYREAAD
jgi:glycosyltransferase involved in cell wall biosynthesis